MSSSVLPKLTAYMRHIMSTHGLMLVISTLLLGSLSSNAARGGDSNMNILLGAVKAAGGRLDVNEKGLITRVSFRDSPVSDQIVAELAVLTSLQSLSFEECNQFSGAGFKQYPARSPLRAVVFTNCQALSDECFHELARIRSLESVILENCNGVTGDGIEELSKTRLLRFKLVVGDKNQSSLVEKVGGLKSIRELTVKDRSVSPLLTDAVMSKWSGLRAVQKMVLFAPAVTGKAFGTLSDLAQLETLLVSSESLDDAAAFLPASWKNLHYIGFWGGNSFSDKGLARLAKVETLNRVYLAGLERITQSGIQRLIAIKSLEKVGVYDCEMIDAKAAAELEICFGRTKLSWTITGKNMPYWD